MPGPATQQLVVTHPHERTGNRSSEAPGRRLKSQLCGVAEQEVAWPHPSPYSRHHGNALKRIRLRKRGRNSCSWPEDLAVLRSQLRPKRLQTQGEPYQDPRAALRENRVIHPEVCTDFRGTSESSLCNTAGGPSPAPISNLRRSCSNRTRGVRTGFRQTGRPCSIESPETKPVSVVKRPVTRLPRLFEGDRTVFSTDGAGTRGIHVPKNERGSLTPYIKVNLNRSNGSKG